MLRRLLINVLFLLAIIPVPQILADDVSRCAERHVASEPLIPLANVVDAQELNEALDSGYYTFAGNAKCRLCHQDFFVGRKQDRHEHAFRRLVDTGNQDNERCFGCHTTGYGLPGGFSSIGKTPSLLNVQCEGCHGPGNEHIRRNARGGFLAGSDRPEILRKMCLSCHDPNQERALANFDAVYESYRTPLPGSEREATSTSP